MYTDVTTQGEKTFYSKIGDLLGWFCIHWGKHDYLFCFTLSECSSAFSDTS